MDAKLYITEIINELTFVKDSIREDDCTKLIDAIQQSQRVFCYGLGRAGFSMKAFTMRLMHMGKEVYFLTETITPNFGPGDLFIVSSASGETAQLVALAKKARQLGGAVAVLMSMSSCKLMPLPKIKKILFSARHSRWRRCMSKLCW
nr:SIS domain-containing protein [Escherichia coli]